MQYAAKAVVSRALPPATNRAKTRSGEHVIFWLKATRQLSGTFVGSTPGLDHI